MRDISNIERHVFLTACKVMHYNDYRDRKHNVPFVDIGYFEGKTYKSDIKIWLNRHVTIETEIGELKTYTPFECQEFTSFIISTIHQAKYIISKGLLDEFTYNSLTSSIGYLFSRVVFNHIVSYRNLNIGEDVDIPITNDKRDLEQLLDIINTSKSYLDPLVKYTSPSNSVFYILRSGNVVVEGTYIVPFDEFEKVMKMASLLQRYVVLQMNNIKDESSRYFDDLINLISEK